MTRRRTTFFSRDSRQPIKPRRTLDAIDSEITDVDWRTDFSSASLDDDFEDTHPSVLQQSQQNQAPVEATSFDDLRDPHDWEDFGAERDEAAFDDAPLRAARSPSPRATEHRLDTPANEPFASEPPIARRPSASRRSPSASARGTFAEHPAQPRPRAGTTASASSPSAASPRRTANDASASDAPSRRATARSDEAPPTATPNPRTRRAPMSPPGWARTAIVVAALIEAAILVVAVATMVMPSWGLELTRLLGLNSLLKPSLLAHAVAVVLCLLGLSAARESVTSKVDVEVLHNLASDDETEASATVGRRAQASESSRTLWALMALSIAALGPLGLLAGTVAVLVSAVMRLGARGRPLAQDAAWMEHVGARRARVDGHPSGVAAASMANIVARAGAARGDTPSPRPSSRERSQAQVHAAMAPPSTPVAFDDVMAHGSVEQKEHVLMLIGTSRERGFARTLRLALNDREPTVRMLAAAICSRFQNQFLDRSVALETLWAAAPQDARRALELGRHYDEFAATGLLDETAAMEYRERALEMYEIAAEQRPNDMMIDQAIMRVLVRLRRDDDAIERFAAPVHEGRATTKLIGWYLECLFRRGRYAELRRLAARFTSEQRDVEGFSELSAKAARLWARRPGTRNDADFNVLDDVVEEADHGADRGRHRHRNRDAKVVNIPYFRPTWQR